MKTLATIGDNCVDIYPQLNKAFSGGNAVNVLPQKFRNFRSYSKLTDDQIM